MTTIAAPARPARAEGYVPFPNVGRRNVMQERIEVPCMVRALGLPRGRRVLEVGCGRGVALPPLSDLLEPSCLVGVDIEPAFIDEAARHVAARGVDAELQVADVRRLPFADRTFDLVIDFGTCYHIAWPHRALAEIARVLAPGGRFVEETPLSQLLSHPVRSLGRRLPWRAAPALARGRCAVLWSARFKR